MKSPVAFFIFNRPETTARVFVEIAKARPQTFLVVADGPRASRGDDHKACAATREIIDRVDWPCEVLTNFSEVNLGCKRRVSSGLDWVFQQVEEAIILEDDCFPDPSFFPFCAELLEKYRGEEKVMTISGDNFHQGQRRTPHSYFFSRYPHIWGWASWRRAWRHYDVDMKEWPRLRETPWLQDWLQQPEAALYWRDIFDRVSAGKIDTWDYQWLFACWVRGGLAVTPETNLVTNIGFGEGSTHTTSVDEFAANLPLEAAGFPLNHPRAIERQSEADDFESEFIFRCSESDTGLYARARRRLSRFAGRARTITD